MPGEITGSGNAVRTYVLGAVSFLNAKPLVAGLIDHPQVRLEFAVPSMLAGYLHSGRVDAALVPVVDLAGDRSLKVVSDACIASDGETLTVRVFTRVPPHRIARLAVDGDSHTSVVLARLIWLEMFGYVPPAVPLPGKRGQEPFAAKRPEGCSAQKVPDPFSPNDAPEKEDGILLIGDKVVAMRPRGFAFEIDLGAAWRELTGLPFVYAVWAALAESRVGELPVLLSTSRDMGLARLNEICSTDAPAAGWPVEIARRYFTEYLDYRLTERHRKGMELFLRMATDKGLLAQTQAARRG